LQAVLAGPGPEKWIAYIPNQKTLSRIFPVIFGLQGRLEPLNNKELGVSQPFERIVILQGRTVGPAAPAGCVKAVWSMAPRPLGGCVKAEATRFPLPVLEGFQRGRCFGGGRRRLGVHLIKRNLKKQSKTGQSHPMSR
jgi:hypothetical protein